MDCSTRRGTISPETFHREGREIDAVKAGFQMRSWAASEYGAMIHDTCCRAVMWEEIRAYLNCPRIG